MKLRTIKGWVRLSERGTPLRYLYQTKVEAVGFTRTVPVARATLTVEVPRRKV